jgi:hypothetical protein
VTEGIRNLVDDLAKDPNTLDIRVQATLAPKLDYTVPSGKAAGQQRAEFVTLLRERKLWPPEYRR